MRALGILPLVLSVTAVGLAAQRVEPELPHVFVVQATITQVGAKRLQVHLPGKRFPSEREVDVRKAVYQTADSNVVTPFSLHVGDRIIVVVNATKGIATKAHFNAAHPNPNALAPLEALVIEVIQKSDTDLVLAKPSHRVLAEPSKATARSR